MTTTTKPLLPPSTSSAPPSAACAQGSKEGRGKIPSSLSSTRWARKPETPAASWAWNEKEVKPCEFHLFNNIEWRISLPSSPASYGRSSCSGSGPSSGPRRRALRPRWDKPSWLTALWLRKRHKMKEMQKERQIEIQNLISQLDDKRNEALLYKNQILELQAEQQKGSIIKEGFDKRSERE